MTKNIKFTNSDLTHIAELSKLKLEDKEKIYLAKQFSETLDEVEELNELSTQNTPETSQVTGLKNIFRKDNIDEKRILSQDTALSNAKRHHNGFFVVKAILNEK